MDMFIEQADGSLNKPYKPGVNGITRSPAGMCVLAWPQYEASLYDRGVYTTTCRAGPLCGQSPSEDKPSGATKDSGIIDQGVGWDRWRTSQDGGRHRDGVDRIGYDRTEHDRAAGNKRRGGGVMSSVRTLQLRPDSGKAPCMMLSDADGTCYR
jgi:hypothetical protein